MNAQTCNPWLQRRAHPALAALLFVAVVAACGGDDGTGPGARTVSITPSDTSVAVIGDSVAFTAFVDGAPVSGTGVTWSSSDESVVVVGGNGVARAVGLGSAVIRARVDDAEGVAVFRVNADTEPPALVGFDMEPTAVQILNQIGVVNVSVDVTDDRSGVALGIAQFTDSRGNATVSGVVTLDRTSGTLTAAQLTGVLQIPVGSEPGTWNLVGLTLRDRANNEVLINQEALRARGFPTEIQVSGGGG